MVPGVGFVVMGGVPTPGVVSSRGGSDARTAMSDDPEAVRCIVALLKIRDEVDGQFVVPSDRRVIFSRAVKHAPKGFV